MEKKVKKRALFYGLAAILMASVLGALCFNFGVYQPRISLPPLPNSVSPTAFLSTFSSSEALKTFLAANSKTQGPFPYYGPRDSAFLSSMGAEDTNAKTGSMTFQYSSTNIQVAGVDEADSVKTDGEYIYVLSGNTVSIVKAYPAESVEVISRIVLSDLYPVGIFVDGDRLVVLGSKYSTPRTMPYSYYYGYYDLDVKTFMNVYDIHDKTKPALLRDLTLTGSYFNARRIGNYVYFVASQPAYVIYDTAILPKIYSNGQVKEVAATEIHYFNSSDDYYQYTTFVAANVQNTTEAPVYLTVMLGGASTMYVSPSNMYLTFKGFDGNTTIYRVHVEGSNMTCQAKGTVRGHELNQFSMDEFNGYFRIATNAWVNGTQNNVYVLNMNLSVVGKLENLASGENLHSSRFMGNRGYLVTFIKTDPLFVINLTDPTNPAVLGELEIPGYSDYLHPYDETHLIGVGKAAVGADEGNFAWYQGIKVSLFDVSNVSDPKQIDTYVIGDRGSDSPILDDHKAFLFDYGKSLLVIPVLEKKIDASQYPGGVPPYAYGEPVWQGAYVFNLTLGQGFKLKGKVTHMDSSTYIWNSTYWVKRSLYIEDVLYTISDGKLKANRLADLGQIKEVSLP